MEAGFPEGVVQVLPGHSDVGRTLVRDPQIDKISFTGSTEVGFDIMRNAHQNNIKRVTLELGGKSPLIVCEDADVELAAKTASLSVFYNSGQCCVAGTRIYIHEKVYDQTVKQIVKIAKVYRLGDPMDKKTNYGPQINKREFDKIMGYIASGKQQGAKCILGGKRSGSKGFFIEPTIFTECNQSMKIVQEEIFGPVMSVIKFSDYNEVIKSANASQ